MSLDVFYALLTLALAALTDFLYKIAQRRGIHTASFMVLHGGSVSACMALAAALGPGFRFSPGLWLAAPLFGAMGFTSRILFVSSLRDGEATVNPAIFKMSFVLTAALAIAFLGEPLTAAKAAGVAAATAALYLFSVPAGRAPRFEKHTAQVLGAMALAGVLNLFYKLAMKAGLQPQTLLAVQALCAMSFATANVRREGGFRPRANEWLFAPVCGTATAGAAFFLMKAYQHGEASVVAPIALLSFPVTGFLAVAFLGERLTPRKLAALGAAAAAIFALSR